MARSDGQGSPGHLKASGGMIDWQRVDELRGEVGEKDFAEVLEMFFDEVAEVLGGLGNGGVEATRRDLHFLKGSAMNIGLSEVSSLCRNCEVSLAENPDGDVDLGAIGRAFLASKDAIESRSV